LVLIKSLVLLPRMRYLLPRQKKTPARLWQSNLSSISVLRKLPSFCIPERHKDYAPFSAWLLNLKSRENSFLKILIVANWCELTQIFLILYPEFNRSRMQLPFRLSHCEKNRRNRSHFTEFASLNIQFTSC